MGAWGGHGMLWLVGSISGWTKLGLQLKLRLVRVAADVIRHSRPPVASSLWRLPNLNGVDPGQRRDECAKKSQKPDVDMHDSVVRCTRCFSGVETSLLAPDLLGPQRRQETGGRRQDWWAPAHLRRREMDSTFRGRRLSNWSSGPLWTGQYQTRQYGVPPGTTTRPSLSMDHDHAPVPLSACLSLTWSSEPVWRV
jgi:hypothetical protein